MTHVIPSLVMDDKIDEKVIHQGHQLLRCHYYVTLGVH